MQALLVMSAIGIFYPVVCMCLNSKINIEKLPAKCGMYVSKF